MFVGSTDAASELEQVNLVVAMLCSEFIVAHSVRMGQNSAKNVSL
jgi:hypothetical protein